MMNIRNKDWMALPRATPAYISGVDSFLDMAFQMTAQGLEILCPCKKCLNRNWYNRAIVRDHLIVYGFQEGYTEWVFHGEGLSIYSQDCINNELPTNSAIFIETRKRQPEKTYKESFDDTSNKISQMQVVQSQQNSADQLVDAFSMVMGGTRPGRVMLYGRSVTPTDLKGISGDSFVKVSENFIEDIKEQMREEVRKEMEEQLATYKSSMEQQFQSMILQLQALVPGMAINQVDGFNMNFGSPGDANSAPNQATRGRNGLSSPSSSHGPQGQ